MRIDSRSGVGFCVKYAGSIVDLQKIRQTRYSEACMDPGFFFQRESEGYLCLRGWCRVCVYVGGLVPGIFQQFYFVRNLNLWGGGLVQPPALIFIETCDGNPLLNKLQYFLLLI